MEKTIEYLMDGIKLAGYMSHISKKVINANLKDVHKEIAKLEIAVSAYDNWLDKNVPKD